MPTSFNLQSPYQQQMADIDRRQKMSEILQQQSFQPMDRFGYNGIEAPTPATAGLAKMLQQAMPAFQQNALARERKQATDDAVTTQKKDFSDILAAMAPKSEVAGLAAVTPADIEDRDAGIAMGTGAKPLNMNMAQETVPGFGDPGAEGAPAQKAEPTAAYLAMMKSKDPGLNAAGLQGFIAYNQSLTAQQQALQLEAAKKMMPGYGDDARIAAANERNRLTGVGHEQQAARLAYEGVPMPGAGGAAAAPGAPGLPPAGAAPAGAPAPAANLPARPPGMSDKAYAEFVAKDAEERQKKIRTMEQLPAQIARARAILKPPTVDAEGNKIAPTAIPTSSGAGLAADVVTDFFGIETKSKDQAGALKTIAGWLTSSVPRMEGPQSDADVKSYREMAAKVGDASVTISERLRALDELEAIASRYAPNGMPVAPAGAPAAPGGVPSATGSVKWGRDPVSGKPMVIRQ